MSESEARKRQASKASKVAAKEPRFAEMETPRDRLAMLFDEDSGAGKFLTRREETRAQQKIIEESAKRDLPLTEYKWIYAWAILQSADSTIELEDLDNLTEANLLLLPILGKG